IRVYLAQDLGPAPGNAYTLNVTHTPAPCMDDTQEDNDSQLAAPTLAPGTFTGLMSCPNDDDFYGFNVNTGDHVDVLVHFTNAEGDLDARIVSPCGFSFAGGSSTDDDETFSLDAELSGIYAVQVYMYQDAGSGAGNPYTLTVSIGPPACVADALEENDT